MAEAARDETTVHTRAARWSVGVGVAVLSLNFVQLVVLVWSINRLPL